MRAFDIITLFRQRWWRDFAWHQQVEPWSSKERVPTDDLCEPCENINFIILIAYRWWQPATLCWSCNFSPSRIVYGHKKMIFYTESCRRRTQDKLKLLNSTVFNSFSLYTMTRLTPGDWLHCSAVQSWQYSRLQVVTIIAGEILRNLFLIWIKHSSHRHSSIMSMYRSDALTRLTLWEQVITGDNLSRWELSCVLLGLLDITM